MGNTRYLLNETNIQDLNFDLIYISKSKYENDWHSTPHTHPFTEVFFITHGQGYFQLVDNVFPVKEGNLILINPNCPHTERSSTGPNPLEYIVFGINNLAFSNTSDKLDNDSMKKLYRILNFNDSKKDILNYLNKIIIEVETKEANYELACKSFLTLFLIYISRHTKANIFIADTSEKMNVECMKIRNYIDAHYSDNITLDFLANLTYVNKFHLVHLFTKEVGISPINYLINKRIEESKNLLSTTNYSVKDIAAIVGFSNSSYFSQMFKKVTGHSPKSFKNTLSNEINAYRI